MAAKREVPTVTHYDVTYLKRGDKNHFILLGRAFPEDNGRITVKLDAYPLHDWDGKLYMFPH